MSISYLANVQEWCRSQCRAPPRFCNNEELGVVTLVVDGLPPITEKNREEASKAAWKLIQRIMGSSVVTLERGVHVPLKVLQLSTRIIEETSKDQEILCCMNHGVFTVNLLKYGVLMNVFCEDSEGGYMSNGERDQELRVFVYGKRCKMFPVVDYGVVREVIDFICQ
jgi:hypothetical protein